MQYSNAGAFVAACLNDDETLIGDPWQGAYGVTFTVEDGAAAVELAAHLARFGIYPSTVLTHGEFGRVDEIRTRVYGKGDQENLLDVTQGQLTEERRLQLSNLVRLFHLARSAA